MGRNKMQIHHLHVCIDSIVRRMQRPNHISVLPKIATMMMTVDITDCESCPDFFLLWRRKEQRRKRTIVVVVTHSWNMGHVPNIHFFPRKSKSQRTLLLSKMFDKADKATFFHFLINFKTDAVGYHFRTQGMFATSKWTKYARFLRCFILL